MALSDEVALASDYRVWYRPLFYFGVPIQEIKRHKQYKDGIFYELNCGTWKTFEC